jgi:PAS domain-containing protein
MNDSRNKQGGDPALRIRAASRLAERTGPNAAPADPFAGLRALYDLASTPATAERALALLHELQVHQIEIDLQDEELRRSRHELEVALVNQKQLFNYLPVACLVMDADTTVSGSNRAAAQLLASGDAALVGQRLDGFLVAESAKRLRALLPRLGPCPATESLGLALHDAKAGPVQVTLRASRTTDGQQFLVSLSGA